MECMYVHKLHHLCYNSTLKLSFYPFHTLPHITIGFVLDVDIFVVYY